MRRVFPLLLALGVVATGVPRLRAGEPVPAPDLHDLWQAVQQQSKQIELLTEQVGKLTRAVEMQKSGEKSADSATKPTEPTEPTGPATSIESSKRPTDATAEAAKGEAVPKAEAVPGAKHTVAKGETLTSIAKHYNISIADLKTANKIDNERRLQIGQILSVPTAKTPEPTDKKENP
ncbi:MAG: LysM peptidoglycan-binding domain-containing protein [Chthoniobacter sp.]|uniref:LysM peptidoglycan-binding domain-containing protein n=1 Tax=Chthoniobacter sp. TaxID=2510640 RepID=UPI0032A521FF